MLLCLIALSFVLQSVVALTAQRWFNSFLLINPGLTTLTAKSAQECVNSCVQTTGCSAVSYQYTTTTCSLSMCAALHAVRNNGWNTYIVGKFSSATFSHYSLEKQYYTQVATSADKSAETLLISVENQQIVNQHKVVTICGSLAKLRLLFDFRHPTIRPVEFFSVD